jgi:hypothetical protein
MKMSRIRVGGQSTIQIFAFEIGRVSIVSQRVLASPKMRQSADLSQESLFDSKGNLFGSLFPLSDYTGFSHSPPPTHDDTAIRRDMKC